MIPSGHVDKETDVAVAAQRELREETGYRAESLELFFVARHKETLDYTCNVFIARDLIKDPLSQDVDEVISVYELPVEEALQKVLHCPIQHSVSALALLRYLHDFGA
jgi:ADP-ribose pyrophosphatase